MKFGVVVFPGSNCDRDTLFVLEELMGYETRVLWHKDRDLSDCDAVVLPGGFSYGDYLRSGALARFSPMMERVVNFAERGGFVLGICNGFQVLCESKLLPGALIPNRGRRFICRNIHLLPEVKAMLPTCALTPGEPLRIPIAHSDGAYFATGETLADLRVKHQILFRYCDEGGQVRDGVNPNGSVDNIAGICNAKRNVVGMMPHPERAAWERQGNLDGMKVLRSIFSFWFS